MEAIGFSFKKCLTKQATKNFMRACNKLHFCEILNSEKGELILIGKVNEFVCFH